ncbi:unnamed protein product [Prorocentrum cordatum]|uniref:Uncharacterized protein n=1 Tax=Prorocentrum cordatum TaxID=2364126 RepID=A0ABN9X118_9DINO|nr:unnamed protein product [Polarella glacialis]
MSYLSQLMLLPSRMKRAEPWAFNRIWHLPLLSMRRDDILGIGPWSPTLGAASFSLASISALMRSVEETIKNWDLWLRRLQAEANEQLHLKDIGRGFLSRPRWMSKPMAPNLVEVALGFPKMVADAQMPWLSVPAVCSAALGPWREEKIKLAVARPTARPRMQQRFVHSHLASSLLADPPHAPDLSRSSSRVAATE